eukprot:COSAG06_NODE_4342_length_4354_cov_84.610150_4_plen_122_part_00
MSRACSLEPGRTACRQAVAFGRMLLGHQWGSAGCWLLAAAGHSQLRGPRPHTAVTSGTDRTYRRTYPSILTICAGCRYPRCDPRGSIDALGPSNFDGVWLEVPDTSAPAAVDFTQTGLSWA